MNEDSEQDIMTQFCESSDLGSDRVRMDKDKHGQFMHVEDPVVVAAFVAFCSGNGRRVFLRGSCRDFPESFPRSFEMKTDSAATPTSVGPPTDMS